MSNGYDADLALFVGGSWRLGEGRDAHVVVDPATGNAIGEVPLATAADLDEALAASAAAWPLWRDPPPKRAPRSSIKPPR